MNTGPGTFIDVISLLQNWKPYINFKKKNLNYYQVWKETFTTVITLAAFVFLMLKVTCRLKILLRNHPQITKKIKQDN